MARVAPSFSLCVPRVLRVGCATKPSARAAGAIVHLRLTAVPGGSFGRSSRTWARAVSSVEAEVSVGTLSVSGQITGTVHAKEKVEIHPKGRVHGDMTIARANLVIHEGGVFEGKIDMAGMGAGKNDHDADDIEKIAGVEAFRR